MTNHMFQQPFDLPMAGLLFLVPLFGYNFIKYSFFQKSAFSKNIEALYFEYLALATGACAFSRA
jgi:hypothetical protein